MAMLKRFLMVIGALAALIGGFVGYAVFDGARAASKNRDYVQAFLTDLSLTWRVDAVAHQLGEPVRSELRSASAASGWMSIARLGKLAAIEDFGMLRHSVSMSQSFSAYRLTGMFENGKADIEVVVSARNNGKEIVGFRLMLKEPASAQTRSL